MVSFLGKLIGGPVGRRRGHAQWFVKGLAISPEGAIWVGTDAGLGLYHPNDGWRIFLGPLEIASSAVQQIWLDGEVAHVRSTVWDKVYRDGAVDAGQGQAQLLMRSGRLQTSATPAPQLLGEAARHLAQGEQIKHLELQHSSANIAEATNDGLVLDGVRLNEESGLVGAHVNEIFEDDLGGIWLATNGGLSRFFNGRFSQLVSDYEVTDMKT